MTSYPVKRPRLALSCLVCTRRKVRCGREQPHCSNCERLGETCVYNPGTRDPGTGRVLRAGDNEDSNDGEGPMPNTQKPGNHQSSLDMFFKAPEQGAPYDALALSRDRLSVRNAQFRYVGKSFWGFVNSHVCCVYLTVRQKAHQLPRNVLQILCSMTIMTNLTYRRAISQ